MSTTSIPSFPHALWQQNDIERAARCRVCHIRNVSVRIICAGTAVSRLRHAKDAVMYDG